jgi:hypothetical protein
MLIEQNRWTEYLNELSRHADGYDVTIEVLSSELGDQIEVRRLPLHELAFDPREGIAVSVGERGGHGDALRHVIGRPSRVEATDEPGVPSALMIADETGTQTLLRFAAPDTGDAG